MRRPGLAERQRLGRVGVAHVEVEEVGRAPIRRRAVDRAGLAESSVVPGDGEVAGHPNLLSAADPHPVDAADDGLVAEQDARDHVVEEPHVLQVLERPIRVVGRVLGGVAAGAEGARANAREHHGDAPAIGARAPEREDHVLDRRGRVGVQLRLVVEHDPGLVQALDRHALAVLHRAPLVANVAKLVLRDEVVVVELGHGHLFLQERGSRTSRRVSLWWAIASSDSTTRDIGACSTNGVRTTCPP